MARLRRCRDLLRYSEMSRPNLEAVDSHPDDTVRAIFFQCTKRDWVKKPFLYADSHLVLAPFCHFISLKHATRLRIIVLLAMF